MRSPPGLCRVLLLVLAGLLVLVPTASARKAPRYDSYVALGDSFTAGPFIPNQTGRPVGCLRSDRNYPALVADELDVDDFTDISCSGAKTPDMKNSQDVQGGANDPQFSALSKRTELVTIGIGGNDIGFSEIVENCTIRSVRDPAGDPCKDFYNQDGRDQIRKRIKKAAPKVAAVLRGIHNRSPDADVLIVGYPVVLPDEGSGCFPVVPIAAGDVEWLRGIESKLNKMIAKQAKRNDATFVDTYKSSVDHDVCQSPGDKWVEGLVPTSPAFPVHPNARGMRNSADQVLDKLGR